MEWSSIKARMRGTTSGTSAKPLYHPNVQCKTIFDNLTEQLGDVEEREVGRLRIPNSLAEAEASMERTNQTSDHTDFEDDSADDSDSGQQERQTDGSGSDQQDERGGVGAGGEI